MTKEQNDRSRAKGSAIAQMYGMLGREERLDMFLEAKVDKFDPASAWMKAHKALALRNPIKINKVN